MRLFFSLSLILFASSCEQESNGPKIPFVPVYEEIAYQSVAYKDLWNLNGHIEIDDAGYKGIIVFNQGGNVFRAFEQACSYDPLESCSKVVVDDSGLFLIDKCCNSTFDFSGIPTGGPAFRPLLEYNTRIEGNFLIVYNN